MASDLHATAVQAYSSLEQLATELAHAGAAPPEVQAISKMAQIIKKIVVVLGKGQAATADNQPPVAPQPASAPAPGGPPPSINTASQDLRARMQASAAQGR